MKTIITLLSFSFLLFAFLANSQPSPVVDVFHRNLRAGANYYILGADPHQGGGLTIVSVKPNNNTSPIYAAPSWGLPLTFSPINLKKGVIRESTDLNIKFSATTTFANRTLVWKIQYDSFTKQYFVTSGGVEGNPGSKTVYNWFKIEKFEFGYKLVFCPTVCKYCKVICRDVGLFIDNQGTRRLALSVAPFKIIFWEA